MKNYCVVGGGISGILSALLLSGENNNVYLVEKEESLGGLLRSVHFDGLDFDFGTHVLSKTGTPAIDDLMFDTLASAQWHTIPYLKNGNYFFKLNNRSPFADTRLLPQSDYEKGLIELQNSSAVPQDNYPNLKAQLDDEFGVTFTEKIFRPVYLKFFNKDLEYLAPNSHLLIGPGRLVAMSPEEAREAKKNPAIDRKLAFHSFEDSVSPASNYYPSNNGIGIWIEALTKKLKDSNVKILSGKSLTRLELENKHIKSFSLASGEKIECDEVIWTIAPPALFSLTGLVAPPPEKGFKFERLLTSIFHFSSPSKALTDLHYLTCFDPKFKSFRVTLYDNMQPPADKIRYRVTVETLTPDMPDREILAEKLKAELVQMGIFKSENGLKLLSSETLAMGFPLPTNEFKKMGASQLQLLKDSIDNITFTGKGAGGAFFMKNVLQDTYQSVSNKKSEENNWK